MQVLNYTEFRKDLTRNLNKVTEDAEVVIVSRSKGKNVVMMSLEEYNSIQETLYLMSSSANRVRLDQALENIKDGVSLTKGLIE